MGSDSSSICWVVDSRSIDPRNRNARPSLFRHAALTANWSQSLPKYTRLIQKLDELNVRHISHLRRNLAIVGDKKGKLSRIAHLLPQRVARIPHEVDVVRNGRVKRPCVPPAVLIPDP